MKSASAINEAWADKLCLQRGPLGLGCIFYILTLAWFPSNKGLIIVIVSDITILGFQLDIFALASPSTAMRSLLALVFVSGIRVVKPSCGDLDLQYTKKLDDPKEVTLKDYHVVVNFSAVIGTFKPFWRSTGFWYVHAPI